MTDATLPTIRFESDAHAPAQRWERWRETVSSLYELGAADPRPDFLARTTVWHLGPLVVSTGEYVGAQRVRRTPQLIRRDQIDHYKLTLRLAGRSELDVDGQTVGVAPGDIVLEDLGRPGRYLAHGGRNIIIYIARDALEGVAKSPGPLHGRFVRGAVAALFARHLHSLVDNLPSLRSAEAQNVTAATSLLLAACLVPTAHQQEQARPLIETNLTRQICRHIDGHLTDPTLTVPGICAAFGISRATLYRLFAELGGVQAYVRERRLTRVHTLLSSDAAPRYLARLVDEYGFGSASDFSRAFRAQFGYSPKEARAMTGRPDLGLADLSQAPSSFSAWMRSARA